MMLDMSVCFILLSTLFPMNIKSWVHHFCMKYSVYRMLFLCFASLGFLFKFRWLAFVCETTDTESSNELSKMYMSHTVLYGTSDDNCKMYNRTDRCIILLHFIKWLLL